MPYPIITRRLRTSYLDNRRIRGAILKIASRLAISVAILALCSCQPKPLPSGSTIFQDEFRDSASGWQTGADQAGSVNYQEGWLRFQIAEPQTIKISTPGLRFSDTRIEVDATKLDGPDDNHFGVLCRYKDINNFYIFAISSDGYYGIGKYSAGNLTWLGAELMQSHAAIQQGNSTNHLRVDCTGTNLALSINGQLISLVSDTGLIEGDVGLIAGSAQTAEVDILFDNFIVTAP